MAFVDTENLTDDSEEFRMQESFSSMGTDEPREECGVFGMYDLDGNDVASTIYYGLFALQHRGQ